MYGRLRDTLLRYRRPETRIERDYPRWRARRLPAALVEPGPLISVIMPAYRTPPDLLMAAIASVRAQTYRAWELCVAHDASANMQVLGVQAALDRRIKTVRQRGDDGIAAATNDALALATGDFVAFLDHDDELAPEALARMAAEIAATPTADILFSDEDQLEGDIHCRPYFKPGWNPDLMLAQNLVCHLAVYRRDLVRALGGLRPAYDGSQDYDLALRATRAASRVRHVPDMLYSWAQYENSFSVRQPELCAQRGRAAVADLLGAGARVEPVAGLPQWNRVIYTLPSPAPAISLILPAGAPAPDIGSYPGRVEILAGEAARDAAGDILLFMAAGLVPTAEDWLSELAGHAMRPEIGAVGARIDGPDGRIQHAGFILDPARVAVSLQPGADAEDPGYRGQFCLARSVSAVSRRCLATRRAVFEAAGGFDAALAPFEDVDFCLRLAAQDLRCVWTPHARCRAASPPARPRDRPALEKMRARWGGVLGADPYANPNLVVASGNFVLADPRAVRTAMRLTGQLKGSFR